MEKPDQRCDERHHDRNADHVEDGVEHCELQRVVVAGDAKPVCDMGHAGDELIDGDDGHRTRDYVEGRFG